VKEEFALEMAIYAAMIDRMDQNIGRLLEHLEKNGQLDNTVVFFQSDNGGCAAGNLAYSHYSHPRFDPEALPGTPESFTGYGRDWANVSNTPFRFFKSHIHEGGIATPCIAWFPKRFPGNKIVEQKAHMVDIMPTLAAIAGTAYPESFQGRALRHAEGQDLAPVIVDRNAPEDRTLYFEHMGNCGVIDGDWKLVRFRNEDWELYDLKADRSETRNRAGDRSGILAELKAKYEQWAEVNNVLPREEVEARIPYKF
jgi:arylsulfatase